MNFYERFLALCNDRNVSPSSVAESIGKSRSSVSRWKNGAVPSDATISALAAYFQINKSYFDGDELVSSGNGQKKETATGVSSSGLSELQLSTIQMVSQMDHDTLAKFNAMMKAYLGI